MRKFNEEFNVVISSELGYCILNFAAVLSAVTSYVICKICESEIQFSRTTNRHLRFKIEVQVRNEICQLVSQ